MKEEKEKATANAEANEVGCVSGTASLGCGCLGLFLLGWGVLAAFLRCTSDTEVPVSAAADYAASQNAADSSLTIYAAILFGLALIFAALMILMGDDGKKESGGDDKNPRPPIVLPPPPTL